MNVLLVSHPHYPTKTAITLASLVKGEVLSPEKIRATTGGIAFRCTEYCHSHNHCKKTIIPRKPPTPLPLNERSVGFASLRNFERSTSGIHARPRKRGGGTADIIFWLAVQYSDSPAFMILKLFRAVTVGIVNALVPFMVALLSISIPYAPINPSKTALSHPLFVGERACSSRNIVVLTINNLQGN